MNYSTAKEYHFWMSIVSVLGIAMAAAGWICDGYKTGEQSFVWGVPIGLVGIIGYVVFIIMSHHSFSMRFPRTMAVVRISIVSSAMLFTVFLVQRSASLSFLCPFCVLCWLINTTIFALTVYFSIFRRKI